MEEGSEKVRKWIEQSTKLLVDYPDEVRVEEVLSPDKGTSYFSVYCKYSDQGMVIGKGGENINAVRQLVRAMCLAQYKRRSDVTVSDGGRRASR